MPYIYPPRPEGKIVPSQLPTMEARCKFGVQRKFRGDKCPIHRAVDGTITLYNRHGKKQKYKPPQSLLKELGQLDFEPGKEYWLDSELMHPRIPHVIILYDLLQADRYLYGVTQRQRLDMLATLCRKPQGLAEPPIALRVSRHIWLAETWTTDFVRHYEECIDLDVIEGLVLREMEATLDNWGQKEYEISWQIRCRKPGPNYQN